MKTICSFFVAFFLLYFAESVSAVTYAVTQLDTMDIASGVNNNGDVIGQYHEYPDPTTHGALWRDNSMIDLGTLTRPSAINDLSQIIGDDGNDACIWESGIVTYFQPQESHCVVGDINSKGIVVGSLGTDRDETRRACFWSNGVVTELGVLPGGLTSQASGINNFGQIVGRSQTTGSIAHPVLWDSGTMIDLGLLPGSLNSGYASDINDKGQIVGSCKFSGNGPPSHPFLWEDGVMIDLGLLPDGSSARATAINNRGQIVGSCDSTYWTHGFLWEDGIMTDLNSLINPSSGWTIVYANAINDNGCIVGRGIGPLNQGDGFDAFIMTPIPEPSTLILMVVGLLVGSLFFLRRKVAL